MIPPNKTTHLTETDTARQKFCTEKGRIYYVPSIGFLKVSIHIGLKVKEKGELVISRISRIQGR